MGVQAIITYKLSSSAPWGVQGGGGGGDVYVRLQAAYSYFEEGHKA